MYRGVFGEYGWVLGVFKCIGVCRRIWIILLAGSSGNMAGIGRSFFWRVLAVFWRESEVCFGAGLGGFWAVFGRKCGGW